MTMIKTFLPLIGAALVLSACVMVVPIPLASVTTVSNSGDGKPGTPVSQRQQPSAAIPATPWPASANCARPAEAATLEAAVLARANALRAQNGLPGLRAASRLRPVAQKHACDNAARQVFSHEGSDGAGLEVRLKREGYRPRRAAENTGLGFAGDAGRAMDFWENSPKHRANLLDPGLSEAALGYAAGPKPAWVIVFGNPR